MSDLMKSLIVPPDSSQASSLRHNSSDESFHSTVSENRKMTSHAASRADSAHFLDSFDIQEYLSSNQNASEPNAAQVFPATGPKPLSTTTSYYVSALNGLCQSKALPTPVFDLQQSGQVHEPAFYGTVKIGELSIESENRWRNKKSAKEGLSEMAYAAVQGLPAKSSNNTVSGQPAVERPWASLLHGYKDSVGGSSSVPPYKMEVFSLGSAFSATCTLQKYPGHSFGSPNEPFPSKKSAQTAAAKAAVEFLIKQGELDADGHPVKHSKSHAASNNLGLGATPQNIRVTGQGDSMVVEVPGFESFPQRVAEFSTLLGIAAPRYQLTPSSLETPSLQDGCAIFKDTASIVGLGLEGPQGEVRHVFGKKNAREQIARSVWESLRKVAKSRGFVVKDGLGED